jgi:hypothetical protein
MGRRRLSTLELALIARAIIEVVICRVAFIVEVVGVVDLHEDVAGLRGDLEESFL